MPRPAKEKEVDRMKEERDLRGDYKRALYVMQDILGVSPRPEIRAFERDIPILMKSYEREVKAGEAAARKLADLAGEPYPKDWSILKDDRLRALLKKHGALHVKKVEPTKEEIETQIEAKERRSQEKAVTRRRFFGGDGKKGD